MSEMKPEALYVKLKEVAEKMAVAVSEQNFRQTGLPVKSGLCKIKGDHVFVMNKHLPVRKKIRLLAAGLSRMPHEHLYLIPAIRDLFAEFETAVEAPDIEGDSALGASSMNEIKKFT